MLKLGNAILASVHTQFRQKRIVIKLVFKDEAVMGLAYTAGRVYGEAALLAAFAIAVIALRPRTTTA